MGDKLEEMLDGLDSERDAFYEEVRALHLDQRLRDASASSRGGCWWKRDSIPLLPSLEEYPSYSEASPRLHYEREGFVAYMPLRISYKGATARDGEPTGHWEYRRRVFEVRGNRLSVVARGGLRPDYKNMHELFPGISIERITSRVEETLSRRHNEEERGGEQ